MKSHLALAAVFLLTSALAFAKAALVSGPMLGYQAHREVLIWLETKEARTVALDYWLAGKPETAKKIAKTRPRMNGTASGSSSRNSTSDSRTSR